MMKRIVMIVLAAVMINSCGNQPAQATDKETGQQMPETEKVPYQVRVVNKGDTPRIIALLLEEAKLKDHSQDVLFFARKFLDVPYVAHTLDQELDEKLVINTEGLDCTTYVENVMALTICARRHLTSFEDFCRVLVSVRYAMGKVGYTTRQHYFTYWITDNIKEGLIEEVKLPSAPLTQQRKPKVDYMTKHVASYKMLHAHQEWLPKIKEMEQQVNNTSFTFIPKEQLKDSGKFRQYIKDGDIIGIVTNKAGLDISHVGFAAWHDDGQLHLMNASSLHKKVVDEPMTLYQYLQRQTSSAGITVVRIK